MPTNNSRHRKAERRDAARERQLAYNSRSLGAQLNLIATRPGKSAREIQRLVNSGVDREALIETLNVLSDSDTMAALTEAEAEM